MNKVYNWTSKNGHRFHNVSLPNFSNTKKNTRKKLHWRTKNQKLVGEGFSQLVQDHDFKRRKTLILDTFHAILWDRAWKKKTWISASPLGKQLSQIIKLVHLSQWFNWKMTCLDPIGQVSFKSYLPSKKINLLVSDC